MAFALSGGLDEVTQPLAMPAGRAIACTNHEATESGYARIAGYERFDGRTGPTDFPFYMLEFDTGATAVVAGATVTGATSGATGIVLVDAELSAGAWDGTGEGLIGVRTVTGTFSAGENLTVAGPVVARLATLPVHGAALSPSAYENDCAVAARTYARSLIQTVPGSGPVRGVCELNGTVYAFRNNAGGTACAIHKSTASGWSAVTPGSRVAFTSGGTVEIAEGNTITGATSAATALVERVIVQTGTWAAGTAAGYLVLSAVAGVFVAENLNIGASLNVATIAAAPTAITIPPGGRYFFATYNFYGASDLRRIYGVNGVGNGFEFDGTVFVPIETGMTSDMPTRIAVFRNHLFFAFAGGSVQHSATADPLVWDAILGAAEIAIGSDVADFIQNVDSLIILGEHGIYALTGYDVTDWLLGTLTQEAGAKPFTGQKIGSGIYLDNRGLRSITATQAYGNFAMGTMTEAVKRTLLAKQAGGVQPIASVIVRSKNHYRLFYDDGSGLSFYLGRKVPEPMYFDLGLVVQSITTTEDSAGQERVFFGSDDGYVYEMDKGSSLDGDAIDAFLALSYANLGSPNVVKRVFKVGLEVSGDSNTTIGLAVEYDYAGVEQDSPATGSSTMRGTGGLWSVVNWSDFFWSSPSEDVLEVEVDGQGRNVSLITYSNSADYPPYTLRGATIYYAMRGKVR